MAQSSMSLSLGAMNLVVAKHIQNKGYDYRFQNSCFNDTVIIKDQAVDCVASYKHVWTVIDSKTTFEKDCEVVCNKGQERLFSHR